MRTELPVCTRCCFCLPLRYGLITWGYLKLIVAAIMTTALTITLFKTYMFMAAMGNGSHRIIEDIIVFTIALVIILVDIVLTVLFVIGGHLKHVRLLRAYYIYSIVVLCLTTALVLVMSFLMVYAISPNFYVYRIWVVMLDFSASFANIFMQIYFILLLRSEIVKLTKNCEFRFMNHVSEAVCNMNTGVGVGIGEEKETQDDSDTETCVTEVYCEKSCLFKNPVNEIA